MHNILVLEDDFFVQDVWRDILPSLGKYQLVDCPAEAHKVLAGGFRPDIIFSDWDMPGSNGGEFCASLRAKGDQTPLIIISGVDRSEMAKGRGVTQCLIKPFRLEQVETAIARWARRPSRWMRAVRPTRGFDTT